MSTKSYGLNPITEWQLDGNACYQLKGVEVKNMGDHLLIKPKPASWDSFFFSPLKLSEDFSTETEQQPPQNRDELFSQDTR